MNEFNILKELLSEDGKIFPAKVEVICGKTLSKTKDWWKAVLLVKNKFGSNEKYQIRLYGWRKNREGVYKQKQKFNISASQYISELINIFKVFIEESGKDVVLERIYEHFISKVNELEKQKRILQKQKSRIPELENNLKEFGKLLENKKTTEPKVHKFLKKNTWMFGTNYTRMFKSEKSITIRSRNDYLLQKHDKYYDILDLKSPIFPLFVKIRGNKWAFSKELKNAVSQVMVYLAETRTYYLNIKEETGINLYFPEGIIVIGKRKEDQKNLLRIHNEFLNKIKIWTYNDLLDNARKTIETYKEK